ncbi:MAG: hypothetical protein A3F54_00270 [Candidatus Kerfeldbacteria bacterium RIFCSPHIGHO2_12_FULL_48_17]|uniref:dTDP-4-dehydrorhamnose reductase n=1 Tax=Candidatus Kerfeldbacteria bacterium RIFCSPHIGHO2_12_FULL_48_17 TaxID=1798542 RepID=A0A1G2B0C8_9BACT|nr:MAG: hypothetical protein A3F54_00270 [Candidatus Kerfeldbacteria bacterium RIFCSPHIGHO2_12_FULL_48_17]
MKYLILGNGYVANLFKDSIGSEAEISTVRIENYDALKAEIQSKKPDVVINTAGKTGRPNVDWCEDHKLETIVSNVYGPLTILRVCEELGQYWAHVGSGCVYESKTTKDVYNEKDQPNFFDSFYSRTKAWSEGMLKEFNVLQLRLRMPLDDMPGPRNFVTKITKYEKVINIPNSISIMEDFVKAAQELIAKKATGIFNVTNPGSITHAEILDIYKEIVDQNFKYTIFSLEEMEKITKARRSNCILSNQKMEDFGVHMRPVKEAVRDMLVKYKANMDAGKIRQDKAALQKA